MAGDFGGVKNFQPGYGEMRDMSQYVVSDDEADELHGEFAEIGSPKDEEATKLRVNELVAKIEAETDPARKLMLLTNFVLAEITTAAEVAARLVEKRNMLPNEENK